MAELITGLQIDDDWKKQAQEEKRKLAEAEEKKKAAAAAPPTATSPAGPQAAKGREAPQASFASLVQTLVTQTYYYLGELGTRAGQSAVDLDLAKIQIDLMSILEQKTANNLAIDEKSLLDNALYDARMRFVAVAREYVEIAR